MTDGKKAVAAPGANRRPVHVGLLFHSFESENLGVGAFTVANAALIAEAVERYGGTPVFHVIGARGDKDYSDATPYPTDFTNVGFKALGNPSSDLHRVMKRCDVFFDIAGGDSFTDIYSPWRYSLLIGAKLLAARFDRPFILSPQTIGPFNTWWGRRTARIAMGQSKMMFARDAMSFEALRSFGMEDRSRLSTDLAFLLPFDAATKKSREELEQGGWEVGLNVSGLFYREEGNASGRIPLKLHYAEFTRRLIERLLGDPRVARLHLVPHVLVPRSPGEDDGAVSRKLAQQYPDLVVAPDFASPSEAKSYIATLDLMLGARMHATIAAISSDTAVLPLAYSRKFNGLYQSLDYPYLVDMVNENEAAAMTKIDEALDNLPDLAEAAKQSNAKAHEQLGSYVGFIDRFFADLLSA